MLTRLRGLDLSKKPGLSELIDWVAYIDKTEGAQATADDEKHLGALVKHQSDQQRVRAAVKAAKGN